MQLPIHRHPSLLYHSSLLHFCRATPASALVDSAFVLAILHCMKPRHLSSQSTPGAPTFLSFMTWPIKWYC
ncbi:hypothetical protein GOP47_0009707 [Adiantum capillus-veneris]|uniref:Uncharacterized protein n=1 Tax=Adiantum capillus-veneris TaxID=13818 RepID=A0A9D4UX48_ADICA|nr:hypothetical protein GOP47_0009707 [Adiantum capillus-veneris]